ncbi:sensor histidine kinase [Marinobacter sp. V034]|uniref:sensor histidine kinase n=1 Tax=Marinobacter sp. V034 TaxID=3459610 RepID=UPI004044BA95
MKVLSGIEQIRKLPQFRQSRFERFYRSQSRYRVQPLLADVSLTMTFIGTLIFLAGLAFGPAGNGIAASHIIYLLILAGLVAAHRFTRLRQKSPLIVYLVFIHMAVFSYLGYILSGGQVVAIVGLFFFVSSVGIITLSLRHTLAILALNLLLLVLATVLATDTGAFGPTLTHVLSNWLILMCLVVAPLSAHFFSLFLRNLLAFQFLLRDRNLLLSKTLQTLEHTEDRLAQEQKHQALSHMAKGLLHEIMNPLNGASQAVEFASAINQTPEISEALNDARLQQQRIADIVSDLIEFSRPEPAHQNEQVNPRQLIETAMRFCQHQLRGIEVHIHIPDGIQLLCYPSALTQVFVNLLLNAASALTAAGEQNSKRIDIEGTLSSKQLLIAVRDNGHGIAGEDIKRLTDPFYSTQNTPDNLGLGLSICQTIMRHHNGTMEIRSVAQEWTEVVLALPSVVAKSP